MKKNPYDDNLIENELRDIVSNGGDKLNKLMSRMQKFNSNVVGSNTYFYKKRNELEALMEQKRTPVS